jgi:hypothetical protein
MSPFVLYRFNRIVFNLSISLFNILRELFLHGLIMESEKWRRFTPRSKISWIESESLSTVFGVKTLLTSSWMYWRRSSFFMFRTIISELPFFLWMSCAKPSKLTMTLNLFLLKKSMMPSEKRLAFVVRLKPAFLWNVVFCSLNRRMVFFMRSNSRRGSPP